jgi:hypothetical protein
MVLRTATKHKSSRGLCSRRISGLGGYFRRSGQPSDQSLTNVMEVNRAGGFTTLRRDAVFAIRRGEQGLYGRRCD